MICVIQSSGKSNSRIEDGSYWKEGSYKMNSIESFLHEGQWVSIKYYTDDCVFVKEIILGNKTR